MDSRDEMGKIAKGINVFLEALQTIMKEITTSAASLDEIVGKVSDHVATANDSSADISALIAAACRFHAGDFFNYFKYQRKCN